MITTSVMIWLVFIKFIFSAAFCFNISDKIGNIVVGEKKPYEYLIKSIENFVNQDELIDLMKKNNFQNCKYRNLSGGIVSIHSGWKI